MKLQKLTQKGIYTSATQENYKPHIKNGKQGGRKKKEDPDQTKLNFTEMEF